MFTLSKQSFLGVFHFGLKTPQPYNLFSKWAEIIILPYYFSYFIKENPLFTVDIFFGHRHRNIVTKRLNWPSKSHLTENSLLLLSVHLFLHLGKLYKTMTILKVHCHVNLFQGSTHSSLNYPIKYVHQNSALHCTALQCTALL